MATQKAVKLLLFHTLGLRLLVTTRHVARGRLTFSPSLGAFKGDVFSWHDWISEKVQVVSEEGVTRQAYYETGVN